MKNVSDDAYPLRWPEGWARTPKPRRAPFQVSHYMALTELLAEIKLLRGDYIVISSNMPVRRDGLPHVNARQPADTGVAVYFRLKDRQIAIACDKWNSVGDNIRAIGLSVAAMRGLDRWGASGILDRVFDGFVALPPKPSCWSILGIKPGATEKEILAAYRSRAMAGAHPDHGGSTEAMQELNAARDAALKEIGA
jgi:hypothetical protein